MTQLAVLDYLVIAIYLVVTIGIGLWVGSYVKSGQDLFLAGRSLPWWAVGVSLVATDIGGTDLIGVGGTAYRWGLAVANFEWIGCIPAMIVAAFVFIPHFWRCGITTIPEFLERRFSLPLRTAVAGCWFVFMACNLGVMLLASAIFLQSLIGVPVIPGILATALFAGAYTYFGGLAAVVYTDVLQGVVMIGGCLLAVAIGLWQVGGIGPLKERVDQQFERQKEARLVAMAADQPEPAVGEDARAASYFSLIVPVDTPSPFPWPAILFGLALVLSPGYWIGNQAIVQRSLGARSEFDAKAAYVCGALLKNIIPIAVAVPGLIAFALYPGLENPDGALPTLISAILPSGLRGLFVAAFLAALMSSVDSYLNSAATIFTNDFYRRFLRPNADERQLLNAGRFVTLTLAIWAIGFALFLTTLDAAIYTIFQTLLSFFQGPAIAVLLLGVLFRRVTADAAFVAFFIGVATSMTLFLLSQNWFATAVGTTPLFRIADPFLYYSVWAFLATGVSCVFLSYFTRTDSPERLRYTLRGWKQEVAQ
ncbi:MAG: sodium/solute symporter [Planctomycetaceae bacterium]|nr:sodium/solute symporter [Planctomycetaceae bacterium]